MRKAVYMEETYLQTTAEQTASQEKTEIDAPGEDFQAIVHIVAVEGKEGGNGLPISQAGGKEGQGINHNLWFCDEIGRHRSGHADHRPEDKHGHKGDGQRQSENRSLFGVHEVIIHKFLKDSAAALKQSKNASQTGAWSDKIGDAATGHEHFSCIYVSCTAARGGRYLTQNR